MNSIDKNITNEIIINKSRFICELHKSNNIEEINTILKNIKLKYRDANHYCYAYIIDNLKKCSDDSEPSGTAGLPILNVLENNNLSNILCIVIRYFGGIKLGTGGLTRAYTKSVTEALKLVNIKSLETYKIINISFNYNYIKDIDYILKDINIINKSFDNDIIYQIMIPTIIYKKITNELNRYILSYNEVEEITM